MEKTQHRIKTIVRRFRNCFVFRSVLLIVLSILIDTVLVGYYLFTALHSPVSEWMLGLSLWYLILTVCKIAVLLLFIKRKSAIMIETSTAVFLSGMGLAILTLSAVMYFFNMSFDLTNTTLIINIGVVITLVFSFLGSKYYKSPTVSGSFFRCKKYLSRIEGMFNLILIFQKLITFFRLDNASVLLSFFMCGIAVFVYSLVLGIMLICSARNPK